MRGKLSYRTYLLLYEGKLAACDTKAAHRAAGCMHVHVHVTAHNNSDFVVQTVVPLLFRARGLSCLYNNLSPKNRRLGAYHI